MKFIWVDHVRKSILSIKKSINNVIFSRTSQKIMDTMWYVARNGWKSIFGWVIRFIIISIIIILLHFVNFVIYRLFPVHFMFYIVSELILEHLVLIQFAKGIQNLVVTIGVNTIKSCFFTFLLWTCYFLIITYLTK